MTDVSVRALDEAIGSIQADGPPLTGPTVPEGYLLRTRFLRFEYHDEANACSSELHAHPEHVVFWPERGSVQLDIEGKHYSISLGHGILVPAGVSHSAARSDTTLMALHINPRAWSREAHTVRSVTMNPAARELLIYLAGAGITKEQRIRMQGVCLELISDKPGPIIDLYIPNDPRLAEVCRQILADPADNRSIEEWAWRVSTTSRTLARAFRTTTAMTFSQWRTRARMSHAVDLLGEGIPVGTVARRVGYSTIGAFSTAFHRVLGRPPQEFHPTAI